MRVIDPGHKYILNELDLKEGSGTQVLTFVKREGPGYPGNIGHYPGTNIQECVRALINRTQYLHNQIPSIHNEAIISAFRIAIMQLEVRAARRHGRNPYPVELMTPGAEVENIATCLRCGHIGCKGNCHE